MQAHTQTNQQHNKIQRQKIALRLLYVCQLPLCIDNSLEKLISLFQQESIATSFFVRAGSPCPCSISLLRFCLVSTYVETRSCACCPSLCELIGVQVLLFLEDTVFLQTSTTSHSYHLSIVFSEQDSWALKAGVCG